MKYLIFVILFCSSYLFSLDVNYGVSFLSGGIFYYDTTNADKLNVENIALLTSLPSVVIKEKNTQLSLGFKSCNLYFYPSKLRFDFDIITPSLAWYFLQLPDPMDFKNIRLGVFTDLKISPLSDSLYDNRVGLLITESYEDTLILSEIILAYSFTSETVSLTMSLDPFLSVFSLWMSDPAP